MALLLCLAALPAQAGEDVVWLYGEEGRGVARRGAVLPNGNLVIAGAYCPPDENISTARAMCVDSTGEVLWTFEHAEPTGVKSAHNEFFAVYAQSDSSALLGFQYYDNEDGAIVKMITVDAQGSLAREITLDSEAHSAFAGPDDSYYVVGTDHKEKLGGRTLQVKYFDHRDAAGGTIWYKAMPDIAGMGYFVNATRDAMYLAGSTTDMQSGHLRATAAKLDAQGETLWITPIEQGEYSGFYDLTPTPDGGIFAVGYSTPKYDETSLNYAMAARFDSDGKQLWHRNYPMTIKDDNTSLDNIYPVSGGYLAMGTQVQMIKLDFDFLLLDDDGEPIQRWTQTLRGEAQAFESVDGRMYGSGDGPYYIVGWAWTDFEAEEAVVFVMPVRMPEV